MGTEFGFAKKQRCGQENRHNVPKLNVHYCPLQNMGEDCALTQIYMAPNVDLFAKLGMNLRGLRSAFVRKMKDGPAVMLPVQLKNA